MALGGSLLARWRSSNGDAGDERAALRRVRRIRGHPRGRPGRLQLFGCDFEFVDGRSLHAQFKEIFLRGVYDFESSEAAPAILDCGGNVGLASLRFRRQHPRAQIRAFEADPSIAALLRSNLRSQGDDQTEVTAAAVWSNDGSLRFASRMQDTGHVDPHGSVEIPCVDIAGLCAARVDLLKLDVEGAETEVLARLLDSGRIEQVERIACEWHESGSERSTLHRVLARLHDAGYDYRLFEGVSSPDLDADLAHSGLAAVRYRGATAMLYAWRPES